MSISSSLSRRAGLLLAATLLCAGAARADTPYLGEIRCGLWNFAPRGWALTNGQILPINQNQALFSLLGTNYGGDGRVNFALPNLRGRVAIGAGQGPGLSLYTVGQAGGSETMTLGPDQLPAHSHAVALPGSAGEGNAQSPASLAPAAQARTTLYAAPGNPALAMAPAAVSSTGGGQPFNRMQPFLPLTCVIALQGIFPTRD
ncbi:phage tail protein [Roseateles violae]|uniref:Tail fiber protein n=1 Tax=Roseateles violae TaxID=3058042 RepID=A0ABT8DR32_9BURK|nr:tail fiber protein [Pelomonas sp. PFR6]MDN3920810.1 tail fiber protein [Pelomonas sp. PFR6]